MNKKPVRLALYGCGNRTRQLLNGLYGEGEYQIVAAYDVREESVRTLIERFGGKPCAGDAELIACPEADAFMISLDPFAHPAAFHKTLQAGKPIFIEKPIAMTAKEAYGMLQAAERRKVPVHVGFLRRYHPEHVAARLYIAENPPGRIFGVTCNWFHAGETEMINCLNHQPQNFRLKVSQIPFHCCHAIDLMRLYGGDVKTVFARGVKVVQRPYPSPDEVVALFEFSSGAIGHFHYSRMGFKQEIANIIVHAENYTVAFPTNGAFEVWHRPPYKCLRDDGSQDCRSTYHLNVGPDRFVYAPPTAEGDIMSDFLQAVRDGAPMKVPLETGYKTAEIADAIEMSFKAGREISLPLQFD